MAEAADGSVMDALLDECQGVLDYEFHDRELLERSLTHASIARTRLASNERMEFLGDAILGAIVCEHLYHRLPDKPEGELTRIKSIVVSRNTCAKISRRLRLDRFLLLGKGITANGRIPPSVMAAVWESLIAGVYLDGGFEAARTVVERHVRPEIDLVVQNSHAQNYKSMLQQVAQRQYGETPHYRVLDEKGPDHSKCFHVSALIGSRSYPAAWGLSKKEAEQAAAQNALREINETEPPLDGIEDEGMAAADELP